MRAPMIVGPLTTKYVEHCAAQGERYVAGVRRRSRRCGKRALWWLRWSRAWARDGRGHESGHYCPEHLWQQAEQLTRQAAGMEE